MFPLPPEVWNALAGTPTLAVAVYLLWQIKETRAEVKSNRARLDDLARKFEAYLARRTSTDT